MILLPDRAYRYKKVSNPNLLLSSEEQISVNKQDYILIGVLDVVLEQDGSREILDFKMTRRPDEDSNHLEMYTHMLEQRDQKRPERLLLYWTEEPLKKDALVVYHYREDKIKSAVEEFETKVTHIQAKEFDVAVPPHPDIFYKCDMRSLCISEGVIEPL